MNRLLIVAAIVTSNICFTHWAGEEPYDKERSEFIRKAIEKAGCAGFAKDGEVLRSKYKANKKFLKAIHKSKEIAISIVARG